MTGMGHEDALPPHRPNAGYLIGRRPPPDAREWVRCAESGPSSQSADSSGPGVSLAPRERLEPQ
jgi:hypothetical protein